MHCVNVPSNGGQFLALFIPNLNKLKRSLKMLVVMMSSAIKPLRHAFVIIGTTLSNMLCVQFGGNDNIDEKHDNISKSERLSMPYTLLCFVNHYMCNLNSVFCYGSQFRIIIVNFTCKSFHCIVRNHAVST